MKHKSGWSLMLLGALLLAACGGISAVEGKLVDWNGKPVGGVKIIASQVQPVKGYEQIEAVTRSDGTFELDGLYASSAYVLKPSSDKWTCGTSLSLESPSKNQTTVLSAPIKIDRAFSKSNGSLVTNLFTGATRFVVSADGMIADSETGLEWVVGPDRQMDLPQAEQWVAMCNVAGGGWRMPTREELKTLYLNGVGSRNMDPAFKITGWRVLAKSSNESGELGFDFGPGIWHDRHGAMDNRVFGVRSHLRS
jgi:hypothetical protein